MEVSFHPVPLPLTVPESIFGTCYCKSNTNFLHKDPNLLTLFPYSCRRCSPNLLTKILPGTKWTGKPVGTGIKKEEEEQQAGANKRQRVALVDGQMVVKEGPGEDELEDDEYEEH